MLFFISVVVVLLWFTWPRALLSVVLAGMQRLGYLQIHEVKNDLTIAQTQADIMKRKREARKADPGTGRRPAKRKKKPKNKRNKAKPPPGWGFLLPSCF